MGKASLTIAVSGTYNGRALQRAEEQLRRIGIRAAAESSGMQRHFVTAGAAMAEFGGAIHNAGYKMADFGDTMTASVTAPLALAGAACGAAAIEIDSAMTSVKKTVDGTEQQYSELKQAAIEFSKTNAVSASQILEIEALGAQLGFAIDELSEFSEVTSGLSIATNMGAEQAGTEMARFANITKMSHQEISNYGSALVGLGNNFATTESDISSMAMRLAAAGTQVGMSQADILGLATALSSLGVEAEAGGSAVSTIMSQIDKDIATNSSNVAVWAETAGMSADAFAEAWKTSPVEALSALLSGMEAATEGGGNMSVMLDELGISELRQTDIMKRMAGNSQLVADAVSVANDEWQKNTALQNEVDNRNESMAAQLEILKNRVTAVAESVGKPLVEAALSAIDAAEPLFDGISETAEAFSELDEETQRYIVSMAAMAAAAGPLLSVGGRFLQIGGDVITTVGKISQSAGAMIDGMRRTSDATAKAGDSAKAAGAKFGALNGVLKSTAFGLVIGLVADVVGQLVEYGAKCKTAEEASMDFSEAVGYMKQAYDDFAPSAQLAAEGNSAYAKSTQDVLRSQADLNGEFSATMEDVGSTAAQLDYYTGVIQELGEKGGLTADEQARLREAVKGYNEITGESLAVIDSQNGKLSESKDSINQVADAWKRNAEMQAYSQVYSKYVQQLIEDEAALAQSTAELESASKGWGIWIADFPIIADEASVKYHDLENENRSLAEATEASRSMVEGLESQLGGSIPMFDDFDQALQLSGVQLSDFGDVGEEAMASLREDFDGSLNSIAQSCVENGIKIPQGIADGIMYGSGLPEDQQRIMMDALVLQLAGGDVEAAAQALGHDIDAGLQAGIMGSADMPKVAAGILSQDVIDAAKTELDSHSPSRVFHAIGGDIDSGLANGISGNEQGPLSSMAALIMKVIGVSDPLPGSMESTGASSGGKLAGGLLSATGSVSSSAASIAATALSGVSVSPSQFGATGSDAAARYSGAIGDASAYGDGQSLAGTAKNGLGSVSAYGTGTNFVQGFANGFNGVSLFDKAYSIGLSALSGIKSALGIHSPSREAAKVGRFFGLGAVEGMDSTLGMIAAESDRMAAAMAIDAPAFGSARFASRGASAAPAESLRPYRGGDTYNVNVTLDVESMAEFMTAKQFFEMVKRASRSAGREPLHV